MRIGADERIGIGFQAIAVGHGADHAREIFEIHLMANACTRGNRFEILERSLPPTKEGIAFDVALELELRVEAEGIGCAEAVHLNGVINDKLDGKKRIDALRVAADFVDGFAHGGEIHDCGNAGKVLQENTRGHEGDFFFFGARSPGGKGSDVIGVNEAAILATQEIFKKDAERKRKFREIIDALFFEEFEALNLEDLRADVEFVARMEGVGHRDGHLVFLSGALQHSMITEVRGNALRADSNSDGRRDILRAP